jgi:hypothetical protein
MVTEVTAYLASDGKTFSTKRGALEHEAIEVLKGFDFLNVASAARIVDNAAAITEVLLPLAELLNAKHD